MCDIYLWNRGNKIIFTGIFNKGCWYNQQCTYMYKTQTTIVSNITKIYDVHSKYISIKPDYFSM